MRYSLFLLAILFTPFAALATHWLKLDEKTYIIAPTKDARYLTSNQAILLGKDCAIIIDAHGDFTALDDFISDVKKRISQPVCHLVSTSSDTEQILGMMILAKAFPKAQWHAPSHVVNDLPVYRSAFLEKITRFKQSLQLSQEKLAGEQNADIHQRLSIAQDRINAWQHTTYSTPVPLKDGKMSIELGEHKLDLEQFIGATQADITVFSYYNAGLFSGLSVNSIPYVQDTDLVSWLSSLQKFTQTSEITWLLPAHGKPFKKAQLNKPIHFLNSVLTHEGKAVPKWLEEVYQKDQHTQTRLRLMYELAKAKHEQKMQAQRTVL